MRLFLFFLFRYCKHINVLALRPLIIPHSNPRFDGYFCGVVTEGIALGEGGSGAPTRMTKAQYDKCSAAYLNLYRVQQMKCRCSPEFVIWNGEPTGYTCVLTSDMGSECDLI